MTAKSVIDIDINDAQFKAFYELYKDFQGDVGALPADWQKVGDAAKSSHEAMGAAAGVIAESMLAAREHAKELTQFIKEASEAQKQFRLTTGEGETGLKKMKHEAKELADTIFGIGKFLFKMGAIGLGADALAGFGMNKLAEHAVANQRSARGMGLTTGQYRAFQTDMGRYVDESTLDTVANAKNDPTNRIWLQMASGFSSDQIDKTNAGDLAAQLAIKAHDWWKSTPENEHNTTYLQATGFAQAAGFSMDDMRRLGMADRSELVRAQGQYAKDSKDLNISNRDTDALYSFSRQIELAGQKLESSFTNRLAELGPSLGGLVATLEKDAEILINDVFSDANIKALESGIDSLTSTLSDPKFKDDVKDFVDNVGAIAKAIYSALKLLIPDSTPDPTKAGPVGVDGLPVLKEPDYSLKDMQINPGRYHMEEPAPGVKVWVLNKPDQQVMGNPAANQGSAAGRSLDDITGPKTDTGKANLAYLGGLEKSLGLPDKSIVADIFTESGGNASAVSKVGAKGAMQLMPSTIQQYGVKDPFDLIQNIQGGSENLARLYKFYDGDLRKAIAATNWGEGNLNKDINGYKDVKGTWHPGHGADWEQYTPKETQDHLKRYFAALSRYRGKDDPNTSPDAIRRDLAKATWGGKEPASPTAKAKNDMSDTSHNAGMPGTSAQLNKLIDAVNKNQGKQVKLTITNKSGTSVAVSTNAAPL